MKKTCTLVCIAALCMLSACDQVHETVDFEDLSLTAESSWNGSDGSGGFTSHEVAFNNYYEETYGPYWEGFAYSNMTDTATEGMRGQFNAITGSSAGIGSVYGVCNTMNFHETVPTATFPEEQIVSGVYVTNNAYAYYSMRNGDAFAKQFGEEDWFLLTIAGKDADGTSTGTIDTYLAEGTGIVDEWTWVSLESLGPVKSIEFSLSSSDTGEYGMNTPAYFCIDDLNGTAP